MLTYHGDVQEKRATLAQLRAHRAADQIIQGVYWDGNGEGKGCAVGCLTHEPDGGHDLFPERWGIPVQIAWLIDKLFESLPVEEAVEWPVRFMSAVPVGADLSGVWDRWALWMLTDLVDNIPGLDPSVEAMRNLFARAVEGDEPSKREWERAAGAAGAAGAAWAAEAARAAGAARVVRAAGAAGAAARAARAAGAAAWTARAAGAAAWTARAARDAGDARACDELVRLVKNAPRAT